MTRSSERGTAAVHRHHGRLSLARGVDGRFLLYARANLKFGVVSGGRFVQVTQSVQDCASHWPAIYASPSQRRPMHLGPQPDPMFDLNLTLS